MTVEAFTSWLEAYRRAWMSGDAIAACALFSEDANYYIRPFDAPLHGQDALAEYWQGVLRTQRDVHFNYQVLGFENSQGIAHWSASFTRAKTGKQIELDGILVAEFDADGRCMVFREWWHSHQKETF